MDLENKKVVDALWHRGGPTKEERSFLIEAALPLVRRICGKLWRRVPGGLEFDDLLGAGTLGLLDALERYQPMDEGDFVRYLAIRVKGSVIDELRKNDWASGGARQSIKILNHAQNEARERYNGEVSPQELAKVLSVSTQEIEDMRLKGHRETGIKRIEDFSGEDGEMNPWDRLKNSNSPDPESLAQQKLDLKFSLEVLEKLKGKQRLVLKLIYLEHFKAMDVALILSITEGRVSQIQTEALSKVKAKIRMDQLRSRPEQ